MFLRLALVVEAHGTLVHAVGLHAILATETARVVWGDRAAAGKACQGKTSLWLKAAGQKFRATMHREIGTRVEIGTQGATRHQLWRWVSSRVPAVWPLPTAGRQR